MEWSRRRRARRVFAFTGALALGSGAATWLACAEPEPAPVKAPNLLLITIGTLRPDHLGCYGYPRGTSPHIDGLAESAVVFDRAYGTSSWTLPSIASLLTSEYPSGHRTTNERATLAPGFETLTERLASAGFATAAVVSHVFFAKRYGLDQGFARYDDELVHDREAEPGRSVTSPAISEKGLAWLEKRRADGRRWFLWLHYSDPHAEYRRHPGTTERFGDTPVDLYDGEIAFTDGSIGAVLEGLEHDGLADDTVVILASDHGEAFAEHGRNGHRLSLFEEELRVAMMVRAPGIAPRRVATPVSLVDVAPTALELLRIAPAPARSGVSLVPLLSGRRAPRGPLVAELGGARDGRRVDAVIGGSWKLTHQRENGLSLFDLRNDPREQTNVAAARPAITRKLRAEMQRQIGAARARGGEVADAEGAPLDPVMREQLEAWGYADGPGAAEE